MDLSTLSNLTDPVILFFVLGLLAGSVRSNLEIPPPVTKFLSLYLLMAIGFKGGQALAESGFTVTALKVVAIAMTLSLVIPALGYLVLRRRVNPFDAAAIAATYGSVSAVTFIAASQVVTARGDAPGGHMTVALVLMESPAIVMAVVLAGWARSQARDRQPVAVGDRATAVGSASDAPQGTGGVDGSAGHDADRTEGVGAFLRGAFTEGTFVLLVGSLVIGAATGPAGGPSGPAMAW